MAVKKFLTENDKQVWPITRSDCIYSIDGQVTINSIIENIDYEALLGFDKNEIVFDSEFKPDPEPEPELSSISASYTGGQVKVGTPISSLGNITVKAWYTNDTSEVITNYTITEGNIVEGDNTITVSYQGKTATFKVTGYTTSINTLQVVYNGGNKEYGTVTIEDLRPYLVVTVYYSDGTKKENVTDYEITGELKKGQNSLTVSYGGKTAKFTVYLETKIYTIRIVPVPSDAKVMINGSNIYSKNVEGGTTVTYEVSKDGYRTKTGEIVVTKNEEITVELTVASSIAAVRANFSGPQIPYGSTLDDLRQYLEIKAEYPDGSSEIVSDYELSGELKKNSNNKITVTYEGKTATFYVWVQVVNYTVNISAIPSDAKVMLNGRNSRSENVESGTTVTYEVSKNGYITQTGEILVMKNEDITITLVEQTEYTITYVYRNMDGDNIKDSTSEVVSKGTTKTFSTSDAPIIEGYIIESVNPTNVTISDRDITVTYRYTSNESIEGGEGGEGNESGDVVWYTNMAGPSPRNNTSSYTMGAYFYSQPATIALYVGKPINMIKLQPASAGVLTYGYYSETEFVDLGQLTLEGASDSLVEYRVPEFTLQEGQNFWIHKKTSKDTGGFKFGKNTLVDGAECRYKLTGPATPGTGEGGSPGYQTSLGIDLGYTIAATE